MALSRAFEFRIGEILALLAHPELRVLVLHHEPDMRNLVLRLLTGMNEDEAVPHVFGYSDAVFVDYERYFSDLVGDVAQDFVQLEGEFAEQGIAVPALPNWPSHTEDRTPTTLASLSASYFSSLADAFPEGVGSLVLIVDSLAEEGGTAGPVWSIEALGHFVESSWFKLLVLDGRSDACLRYLEEKYPWAASVDFHFAPEQVEKQVSRDLESGGASPGKKAQHLALAAAFAQSHRQLDRAADLQLQVLDLSREQGDPSAEATALYNIGNTLLEQGRHAEAQDAYVEAIQLAGEHDLHALMGMLLTNLGVALYREGRVEEALESFAAARMTFRGMQHLPGEAHVLDCEARAHMAAERGDAAEACWLRALALYEGITAPHMEEIRSSGVRDVVAKLEGFYNASGQERKRADLSRRAS